MRSHPTQNSRQHFSLQERDIHAMAAQQNKTVHLHKTTFNNMKVFKIPGEKGLYTFDELVRRLVH